MARYCHYSLLKTNTILKDKKLKEFSEIKVDTFTYLSLCENCKYKYININYKYTFYTIKIQKREIARYQCSYHCTVKLYHFTTSLVTRKIIKLLVNKIYGNSE